MNDISAFIIASALLTIMPGPDIVFVAAQSITQGRRAAIAVSLGLASGLLVHTAVAAAGISVIIAQSPLLFGIIKYAGIAYLLYLGVMSLRSGPVAEKTDGVKTDKSFGRLYRIGVTMNLLNPKIIIFFLAFLPPFVAAMGGRPSDVVILGLIFSVQAAVIFSAVSVVGGYASRFLPDSAMEGRAVAVAKAVIYWAIAAYMLIM